MATMIPAWFDYDVYMNNKLAQLKAQEPEAQWTMDKLVATLSENSFTGAEGALAHFEQFGADEEVAPNKFFNAEEYYVAKAAALAGVAPKDVTDLQVANVKAAIADAGMNAWTHYEQYGSQEGVNPSNAFDAKAYLDAKAVIMGEGWTAEKVAEAIGNAGLSVLDHFLQYGGKGEGEITAEQVATGFPVPADQQVPGPSVIGKTYTLTTGPDTLVGTSLDDTFNAPTINDIPTLTAGDNIDGGEGTDTLNVYAGDFSGVTMKSVEVVNHHVAGNLNVSAYADVQEAWQHAVATGGETTANIATKVGFAGTSTGAQTVNFVGAAEDKVAAAAVVLKDVELTTLTVNDVASLTLDVTGKDALTTGLAADALTDLTITGSGDVAGNVTGSTTLAKVDTTKATGNVSLSLVNASNAVFVDNFVYTGGEGNDSVNFTSSAKQDFLTDKVVAIDLGAGDNSLVVGTAVKEGSTFAAGAGTNDTVDFGFKMTAEQAKMFTGFENVKLSGSDASYEVGMLEGVTGFEIAATTSSITKLADASTVTVSGNVTTATLNLDPTTALVAGSSLNLVLDNGVADTAKAGVAVATLNTNARALNITSDGLVNTTHNSITLGANDTLENVIIKGDQAFDLTTANNSGLDLIDGSAATGDLKIDAKAVTTQALTIKGGAGNDSITGGDGADILTGGAGADNFIVKTTYTANTVDTITDFTVGIDKITLKDQGTETFASAKVDVSSQDTLAKALGAAIGDADGSTNGAIKWFQFEGDTYIVECLTDKSGGAGTDASVTDVVVKLAGLVDLSELKATDFDFA